jgi:hypothetical protein
VWKDEEESNFLLILKQYAQKTKTIEQTKSNKQNECFGFEGSIP